MEKSAVVTFDLDLKDDSDLGLHSGDVRPFHPPVVVDTEPGDGYLCPSCPWPWWALHYPSGRVFHRKGRTLFDPPHGQPKFNDRSLRGFMDQILYRGHKPLRTGFFYNEETGAVFGEESAMEHLAQQLHLMDEPQDSQPLSLAQSTSLMSTASTPKSDYGLGRHLNRGLTMDSAKKQILREWRPDEDSSYCCLLSQHSHLLRLSQSLLMVVLSSFDRMTSVQLCISLLTDKEFVELRGSWEGEVVVLSIVGLVVLYMLVWLLQSTSRANDHVRTDIDYVGDLVWPNGAPKGACERPENDRLASNLAVRLSLIYFQLFAIHHLVTDVVQLCHPRKGAMKFSALSYRGRIPRFFALGYVNKVMFHFEESVGVLPLLPNMALVKLPCMAIKVYMFCFLQRSGLLLLSLILDVILNGVKIFKIVSHVQTARKYKSWLADPERSDMTLSAKTVREKLLKKNFFFQENPTTGELEDPGMLGWFWQFVGGRCGVSELRSPMGYLGRWAVEENATAEDLRADWVQRSQRLRSAKSMLRCRQGEEIGRRVVWSCGVPTIPAMVVENLTLVDPTTEKVRTEFWYTCSGKVVYHQPKQSMSSVDDVPDEYSSLENLEEEFFYGRLLTYSSFSMRLCEALARASCTAFYNIAMLNLLMEIVTTKELSGSYDGAILALFIVSRFFWVYISLRRAQRVIVLDWFDRGEYVTNVGYFDRFLLLGSATIVEMFLMPRMVRDAVSLLHPDKTTQPFTAFGGKLYGPRAFILGFPNKDMYLTQSLNGILSQVPVLLADVALTFGLCWTLRARIGLFYFSVPADRERWLWCRLMTWLVLVLTVVNFVLKLALLYRYTGARKRYRLWLKEKLQDFSQSDHILRALKREWRTYYGEWEQVLASGPLSP